ncbi:MAG TPA: alpha/beta fold hydrolase, partial [Phycisphaerae bacterium]|nr:alpha/beta fold hydrolase [Phycisphaerae bacterium]
MQTFLEIPVGRERLAASLDWPEPTRSAMGAPVVVCCHGLTGTRIGSCYRLVTLARRLVAENIACLRFDFRGCGESDGDFQELCVPKLVEDLRAVIAAIDGLPGCDPT